MHKGKGAKYRKSWGIAAAALLLSLLAPEAVQAETSGSITVLLEEGISPEGIRFSCTKIGSIVQGSYLLDASFQKTGLDLYEIKTSAEMRDAAEQLAALAVGGTVAAPDAEGIAKFENLEQGLYLLNAESTGSYQTADAALAAIPSWEETLGAMTYDITVVPKFKSWGPEKMTLFDTGYSSRLAGCAGGAGAAAVLLVLLNRRRAVKK